MLVLRTSNAKFAWKNQKKVFINIIGFMAYSVLSEFLNWRKPVLLSKTS